MGYTVEELCRIGKPHAFTMLLDAIGRRGVVTYGDIAKRLSTVLGVTVSWHHSGPVAGAMMDRIAKVEAAAPPINALVVEKTSRLPSFGVDHYLRQYMPDASFSELTETQQRAALKPIHDDVYNYPHWKRVAKRAFKIDWQDADLGDEPDGKAQRLGFGGPAESPEHRRLKLHVAENPSKFGAPAGAGRGKVEKRLDSCDEIDVWFVTPTEQLAVEVKSRRSSDLDLLSGVYQCVKYGALLRAELTVRKVTAGVRQKLVSERGLPHHVGAAAQLLGVEVQVVAPLRSKSD
jgi:hypothetical protein